MGEIRLDGRRLTVVKIAPDVAAVWLKQTKTRNRNLTQRDVDTYARDMVAGRWRPSGDPIRVDRDGNVIDGQTRLHAIVKAGVTVEMVVLLDADPTDQAVYDSGRPRRAAQQLQMAGHFKHASLAAAIIRSVVSWQIGTLANGHYRLSNSEVVTFAERYRERLEEAVAKAYQIGQNTTLSRPLVGTFAFVAYDHSAEHPEHFSADTVNEFLAALSSGAGLEANDPILVLRSQSFRFQQQKVRETEIVQLYRIVATWRNWRKGRRYSKLQLPREAVTHANLSLT